MFIVDVRENSELFKMLDLMDIPYRKEEINVYVCTSCEKLFVSKPNECECGQDKFIAIKVGDITNEERSFIIERKKDQDLASSLNENHLYDQLERMMNLFKSNASLVFEGNFNKLILNPHNKSRVGQIMSIPATCAQYGVSFIQLNDTIELIKMLKYFDEKAGKEPKLRLQYKKRSKDIPGPMLTYMSITGISEKLAKNIFDVYPVPVYLALDIKNKCVKKIDKIGPKKIISIRKHLWGESKL